MSSLWARVLRALGASIGTLAFLLGIRRGIVIENLSRAFPDKTPRELRALALRVYRTLGATFGEVAAARSITDRELEALVTFDGFDRYTEAAQAGKGVVVAVAHFGNWELLGRACARRGVKLTAITRRLRGRWNAWLLKTRREGGMKELPDKDASRDAVALLRRGEVLAVIVDQNMRPKRGVFVDFFGTPACTSPAAAVYALRARAPLLAAFPVRQPDGTHRVQVLGPFAPAPGTSGHAAVLSLTQQLTRAVEDLVRAHPEQWLWLHRRWKTRPPARP
ncbi:MAG: lysophospholipid acyltransferase family protein [Deltaproteobacteria bacterium]|nr:lysophospholipid acyltransferase family protein [Deltaproteobacteria bacterium]